MDSRSAQFDYAGCLADSREALNMSSRLKRPIRTHLDKARAAVISAVEVYNRPGSAFRTPHYLVLASVICAGQLKVRTARAKLSVAWQSVNSMSMNLHHAVALTRALLPTSQCISPKVRAPLVLALGVSIYFGALYYFRINSSAARQNDFALYYVWAYAARRGINPYLSANIIPLAKRLGLDATKANYPPLFILICEPLSLLPFVTAFWLWSTINLILLLFAVQMLVLKLSTFQKRVFFGGAALLYGPVTDALYWGQAEIIILFLLVLSLRSLQVGKNHHCGIALGLAALCKVYPILLVGYFLLCRRRDVVASALMTVLVGILLSIAVFGPEVQLGFLNALWGYGGDLFLPYAMNVSLDALSSKSLWLFADYIPAMQIVRAAAVPLSKVVVLAMTVCATLMARRRGEENLAFGLWVAAAVLISPVVWFHHLINLLIPLGQLTYASTANRVAFKLGAFSYCFAELALPFHWFRPYVWPAYDFSTQFAIGSATLAALLLAFGAAFCLCARIPKMSDVSVSTSVPA